MPAFYIYYRVDPKQSDEMRRRLAGLFGDLRARCGVTGRLMTKRGEPLLWMEVYEGIGDADRFEAELAAAVAKHALEACLLQGSARKLECFEPHAPCA